MIKTGLISDVVAAVVVLINGSLSLAVPFRDTQGAMEVLSQARSTFAVIEQKFVIGAGQ